MRDEASFTGGHARIRRSFRRGLSTYDTDAEVQASVAARLVALLAEAGAPDSLHHVFEFGCGTGHLTRPLLARFEIGELVLNDLVAEAVPPLPEGAPRARHAPGPVEAIALPRNPDLIASASTVQWIDDLPALLDRLCHSLRPGGWLALSGFGHRQFHELVALGSGAAAPSYADAADWQDLIPRGMTVRALRQESVTLHFPTAIDLLRHLRRTGVNGAARGSWGRGRLKRFEAAYAERFGRDGMLPLTYDPVWMVAQKPDA